MNLEVGFVDIIGSHGIFSDGDWVESKDQDPNGEVRLVQLADIGDGSFLDKSSRFLTIEKAHELKCTFLEPGDILIARMPDPLGRACVFPGLDHKAVTVVDVCIIRPDQNIVHSHWLKGLINSKKFRADIHRMITGTTRQRVSRGNLSTLRFELPLLSEQIKIVTLLKKTEDLIQKRKESIELLDELVRNTFLEMFGDQIGQKIKLREIALNEKGTFNNGPFGSDLLTSELTDEGVPVIYIRDIAKGRYLRKSEVFVTNEKAKKLVTSKVVGGDVLISKVGSPPGAAAIYPKNEPNGIITQDVIRLRVDQKIVLPEFICHWFNSKIGKFTLKSIFVEGTRMRFGLTELKSLEIMIPTLSKQRKFLNIIRKYDIIREKYIQSKTQLNNLYNSLSQCAFNGELDLSQVKIKDPELKKLVKNSKPKTFTTEMKFSAEHSIKINVSDQIEKFSNFTGDIVEKIGPPKTVTKILDELMTKNLSRIGLEQTIKRVFKNHHFNAEILLRALSELDFTPQYTSSKEWKENLKVDPTLDIQEILFEAVNLKLSSEDYKGALRLEQFFYNASEPEFPLKLRDEDKELILTKDPEQQSGVYYKVLA